MFGNHRDAWTFGGSDPSSGTATMMEIVRSIGYYKKANGIVYILCTFASC